MFSTIQPSGQSWLRGLSAGLHPVGQSAAAEPTLRVIDQVEGASPGGVGLRRQPLPRAADGAPSSPASDADSPETLRSAIALVRAREETLGTHLDLFG
jgi:hypothetical protein